MPMRLVVCLSLCLIAYAYVGYPLVLALVARLRPRPIHCGEFQPTISIVMAAHNEAVNLERKLQNLYELEYDHTRVQIVVASDGSTDATNEILSRHAARVTAVLLPSPQGKAVALNAAVAAATGEVLLFLDVRQEVDRLAARALTSCMSDASVGAVSGELHLIAADGNHDNALGVYWKLEKAVRRLESATGSVIGVTGAIYAMRRDLFTPMPPGLILDDVFQPMNVVRRGRRVVFHSGAVARDSIFTDKGKEFGRKVRTLTGNYQLVRTSPWLLGPSNPVLLRFVSHKLLRLLVPLLLLLLFVASALCGDLLCHLLFAAQLLFYALAALGLAAPASTHWRPVAVARTFVMLNLAAAAAFWNFILRKQDVWV